MKRLAALSFAVLASLGATYSGGGVGTPSAGTAVAAAIDCRSFGVTATDGGTLNIKYGQPMMCWASRSTVNGTAVNDAGWVPEVWFDWNWDDASLGSVTRGGVSMDLGKSIGVVAAHAFRPTTFAETCNGGTNSSHTVTLTVYAMVAGARASNSKSLTVCVENPATTWPNPVAYCDDADCSNDTFSNVTNPGTPTHGGNGTAVNTILAGCASSSQRILVEGGVTFSTGSTAIAVGANYCLVESYGTGKALFHFTSTSATSAAISANNAACGGFVMNEINVRGSGSGPRFIVGGNGRGCYAMIDVDSTNVAGEEFSGWTVSASTQESETYNFLVDYGQQGSLGTSQYYQYGDYVAFVGGSLTGVKPEHNMRLPQWHHVVVDATLFDDQTTTPTRRNIIRFAQDCGLSDPCPNSPNANTLALTRNEIRANGDGTTPVQICNSGSGSSESTKCYDGDILRNLSYDEQTVVASRDYFYRFEAGLAGNARERFRVGQNLCDLSGYEGGTDQSCFAATGAVDKIAFFGNVVWRGTATGSPGACTIFNGNPATFTSRNNVAAEDTAGSCTPFSGATEAATDLTFASEPFSGTPVDFAPTWAQFKVTADDAAIRGVVGAYPTDVEEESAPQGSFYESGVDDE